MPAAAFRGGRAEDHVVRRHVELPQGAAVDMHLLEALAVRLDVDQAGREEARAPMPRPQAPAETASRARGEPLAAMAPMSQIFGMLPVEVRRGDQQPPALAMLRGDPLDHVVGRHIA